MPSSSHSVSPQSPIASVDIDQFLSLHGVTVVRQGTNAHYSQISSSATPGTDIFSCFRGYYNPTGKLVDMPFLFNPAVVTTVSGAVTARLPITVNSTASQIIMTNDLQPSLFERAIDCVVSIVADNGHGDPDMSTVYGSTLLPAEHIEATSSSLWPEPQEMLLGTLDSDAVWDVNTATGVAVPSLENIGELIYTTAGVWAIGTGGYVTTGTTGTQVINNAVTYAQYGDGVLSGWLAGPPLPTPKVANNYYILESLPYGPTSETLLMTGCGYAATYGAAVTATKVCYTATFSQAGVVGAWQRQTDLPHAVSGAYSTIISLVDSSSASQDYALVFDSSRSSIYYGQISSDGSVSSWNTASHQLFAPGQPFQIGLSTANAAIAASTTPVLPAGVLDSANIALVDDSAGYVYTASASVDASGNITFTPWQSTSTAVLDYVASSLSGVFGSSVATSSHFSSLNANVSLIAACTEAFTDISSNAIGQYAPQASGGPQGTNGASWVFANSDGTYSAFGTTYNQVVPFVGQLSTKAYPVTWVNVPIVLTSSLPVSSGGSGIPYHLVLQFDSSAGVSEGVNLGMTQAFGSTSRTQAILTATTATATASFITYTCPNSFIANDTVTVSGFSPSQFNVVSAHVVSANSTSFTIANTTAASGSSTGTGAVTGWQQIRSDAVTNVEVPCQIWVGNTVPSGTTGYPLALVDDIDGRVSYMWIGPMTDKLLAASQWTTDTRSSQLLNYDQTTGALASITEVY